MMSFFEINQALINITIIFTIDGSQFLGDFSQNSIKIPKKLKGTIVDKTFHYI